MTGEIPAVLSGLLFEKKLRCPPDSFKDFLVRVMSAGHRVASGYAIRSDIYIFHEQTRRVDYAKTVLCNLCTILRCSGDLRSPPIRRYTFYLDFARFRDAATNSLNSGWERLGRDLNSG